MPKVLILTAKSGFLGHTIIAKNYGALLESAGCNVQVEDVFALEGKAEIQKGNQIYFWIIAHAAWIWRFLYWYWTKIPGAKFFKNNIFPNRFPKTQKLVLSGAWDFIVTTHPSGTAVVSFLKGKKLYTNPLYTTFSDWHIQDFWIYKNVDKYLVVIPEQKTYLKKLGFREDQVAVPRILVGEKFYNAPTKQDAKNILGVKENQKAILVMGGGRGWGLEKIIANLAHLTVPAKIWLIAGSEERKLVLQEAIPTNHPSVEFEILPFVEDPSNYFAAADLLISKPGGLTASQAFLLKAPLLALSPLPGQEDANIKYLQPLGALTLFKEGEDLLAKVTNLLQNPRELIQIAENAYKIAPIDAPKIILAELKQDLYSSEESKAYLETNLPLGQIQNPGEIETNG